MPSFDIVSEVDTHELTNAVDNGSVRSAYTKLAIITMPSTPRSRCNGQRTRNSGRQPTVASAQAATSGNDDAPRNAATWNGG